MATLRFDMDKALNAFLYVANRVKDADCHKIFKILYFADRDHLCKYGRTITTDTYMAMEYGPVPSCIYDMVRAVRGMGLYRNDALKIFFKVANNFVIKPLRDADMDYLSKTDTRMLDKSISEHGELDFNERTQLSHGLAWQAARKSGLNNATMEIGDIMKEGGADKGFTDYILEELAMEREMNRC